MSETKERGEREAGERETGERESASARHRGPREQSDAEAIRTYAEALRVFWSRPGPRVIAATAGAMWGLRALLGPPGPRDVLAAGAAVAWWPFQEWLMHKHLLHLEPREILGVRFDPLFARKHRAHHADPRDVDKTMLPVSVILGAIPGASVGWLLLCGPRRSTVTAMAAYSTMALLYEWTHFIVHTGVPPTSAFAKKVRRNHRLHHYRHEDYWLGFTLPQVDAWLGTDPDPASVPRSRTAMDLHGLEAAAAGAAEP